MWWALVIQVAICQLVYGAWTEVDRAFPAISVPEWEYGKLEQIREAIDAKFWSDTWRLWTRGMIIILFLLGMSLEAQCEKYYVWWSV